MEAEGQTQFYLVLSVENCNFLFFLGMGCANGPLGFILVLYEFS